MVYVDEDGDVCDDLGKMLTLEEAEMCREALREMDEPEV